MNLRSYSLDPNRKMPYMVIDNICGADMECVYAGTYEDCQMYMYELGKESSLIGMEIVPNPYYQKRKNIQLKPIVP